jgi:hypothetical protein
MTDGKPAATSADELRARYGRDVVLAGLAVLLLALGVAVWRWKTAQDVSLVLSALTGTVGTIVGAFFGISAGAAGKEKAEEERAKAEDKKDAALAAVTAYAGKLDPVTAEQVRQSLL